MPDVPRSVQRLKDIGYDYPLEDPAGSMQLAHEILKSQMPAEAEKARVRPMNWLERALHKDTTAVTYPWYTVAYRPEDIKLMPQRENTDVLAHELTHVGQFAKRGWKRFIPPFTELSQDYLQRPSEVEAFATMDKRRSKRRDIALPGKK